MSHHSHYSHYSDISNLKLATLKLSGFKSSNGRSDVGDNYGDGDTEIGEKHFEKIQDLPEQQVSIPQQYVSFAKSDILGHLKA